MRLSPLPLAALAAAVLAAPVVAEPPVKSDFGKLPDGTPIEQYTLKNDLLTVKVITYGGIITEIHAPDRDGKLADVALGFDRLDGYLAGHPYFGAIIGRVANRVGNARFTLDGKEYTLAANNGAHSLHGGKKGFDKVVWRASAAHDSKLGPYVELTYTSPDGEEGYPGRLHVSVTYTLAHDTLEVVYRATTDQATPVNLTQHSYFNLAGHGAGDVLGHEVMIAADKYTPSDATLLPSGELAPVKGTPLDFTTPTAIGRRIREIKADPVGYDHNYVLRGDKLAARVVEPKSGRVLEMTTTEPGVQFYTGNFLDGKLTGKGGAVYKQHTGFCLEAQHYPDSVNKPTFPSVILKPGATYRQATSYRFTVAKGT
jgi:aldose 1-epimerase